MLKLYTVTNMWAQIQKKLGENFDYIGASLSNWFSLHFINIVAILLAGYVFRYIVIRFVVRIIKYTVRHDLYPTETDRKRRIETLESLIKATIKVLVWILVVVMIISEVGIDAGPLLASAGIIGVVVGLGAQSLIKDFLSGLFIITENQYRIGDVVELNQISGTVEAITIRITSVRDLDGDLHHIPNGSITVTTNKTMDFAQINEDVIVARDSDIDEVEHVINHVGEQLATHSELKPYILEAPHFDRVDGFDKDGLRIKVFGKTAAGEQWRVKGEFYKRLKKAFDQHDIEVPYAQLTNHEAKKK